jgi:hypothetical protein
MVGKKSLTALCCASVLLLSGAGTAFAADAGEYEALVEVTVPSQADVDSVVEHYDAAEYKRVEDDGTITLNLFVTDEEKGALKAAGYKIGKTIEDSNGREHPQAHQGFTRHGDPAGAHGPDRRRALQRRRQLGR